MENLSRDEVWLKKLTEAVMENLGNENFGVSELSETMVISRFQLHRKLKLLRGKSISQFVREVRLEKARKMLYNDVATAAEIAFQVGFSSPSYFNKCFHDLYGYSPGEARRRGIESKNGSPAEVLSTPNAHSEIKPAGKKIVKSVLLVIATVAVIILASFYLFFPVKKEQVSIAILPLDNLTGSSDQTFFVNGIHDALIGELGQISAIRVISRTSTLRYPKSKMLLQDIARELGVNLIVEGSVYGAGDSIRIQLQLIEVFPEERHIWAKEYHENIQKALAVHSTVVQDIAKEIQVSLTAEEESRLGNHRLVNPETYKAYLRGSVSSQSSQTGGG